MHKCNANWDLTILMPACSYDPFRRHDQYGRKGEKPQPLAEQARLVAVIVLLVPFKLLGCLLCLVSCYLTCRFAFLLPSAKRADWVAAAGKVRHLLMPACGVGDSHACGHCHDCTCSMEPCCPLHKACRC